VPNHSKISAWTALRGVVLTIILLAAVVIVAWYGMKLKAYIYDSFIHPTTQTPLSK
jgi:hypothetical protein